MLSRKIAAAAIVILTLFLPAIQFASALPPLESLTFPIGTIVVPMDDKQAQRILVYGFIHALLRNGTELFRIIEPPDATLKTSLHPAGAVYKGGPILIEARFSSTVSFVKSDARFGGVTTTTLTASFSSNAVFRVRQPTKILVVRGIWGRTDITLSRMQIPFDIISPEDLARNPSILLRDYTLFVIDCPGWFGRIPSAVSENLKTRVQQGSEVIFTDIAMRDLNATFPGYVTLDRGNPGTFAAVVHNPPVPGFSPEFPSQYFNPGPSPNDINVATEGSGYVVSGVAPAQASNVRILVDSGRYGVPRRYAILAFYFEVGQGIVEGFAFHPQEQIASTVGEKGYYAVHEFYGNKFVHGVPPSDFVVEGTPESQTVVQGQTATFTITVRSLGVFSLPVNLGVTVTPPGPVASFSVTTVTPPVGGTATSTLSVATTLTTPVRSYELNVTGTDPSSTPPSIRFKVLTLTVVPPPPDFSLSANPDRLEINITSSKTSVIRVTSIGSFDQNVSLSVYHITPGVLPTGVTASFTPPWAKPPASGSADSILRVSVGSSANATTYILTVTGTNGTHTRTATITLVVIKPPVPPLSPFLILLLLSLLLLSLGVGVLAAVLASRRRRPRPVTPVRMVPARPRRLFVVPRPPGVRCRNCGQMIPASAAYCPYCGRPRFVIYRPRGFFAPRFGRALPVRPRLEAIWGFIFALASGILILLNAGMLLAAGFWAAPLNWSLIFWWLPTLGQQIAFVIGLVVAIMILLASMLLILGRSIFASTLIFPLAVLSLIIGGGFIAGFALGVAAGILGVVRR